MPEPPLHPHATTASGRTGDAPHGDPPSAAVVGAGVSGLACARTLRDRGWRVQVYEKARGPGGRISTRREGPWRFDHGAQYFTVRDDRLSRWVEPLKRKGVVCPWQGVIAVVDGGGPPRPAGDGTERFVGVPGMNALCGELATGVDVQLGTRVGAVEPAERGWRLATDDGRELGRFDAVVVSAPARQTAALLATASPAIAEVASTVEMDPCWSVMVGFDHPLEVGLDAAFVNGSPLSWVARNGSKPGRPDAEAWVLHATGEWSREHLETEPSRAARALLEAFDAAVGGVTAAPVHLNAHRWRYALPTTPLDDRCLVDGGGLVACGDWCGGPRVEGAFLSGLAAAAAVDEAV